MNHGTIYLIDDDQRLAEVLMAYLQKYNYKVIYFDHPQKGLDAIKALSPDLVVLDIMMPDKDGLQVCREIRSYSQVPIVFLSARGDTMDRIVGLEMGADDYLPKPFEPRELVARIESILRRNHPKSSKEKQTLILDPEKMIATFKGEALELTATEFQALYYLYSQRQKIVSRDELLTHIQGMDSEVYGRAIDILISRLRQKLGDDSKKPSWIKTIRGQGYRFIGDDYEGF